MEDEHSLPAFLINWLLDLLVSSAGNQNLDLGATFIAFWSWIALVQTPGTIPGRG